MELEFWIPIVSEIPDSLSSKAKIPVSDAKISRIPDSLSLEVGFWIPVVSGIPDSLSCTPVSKAQDSGFHSKKFLDSGLHHQKFPGSQKPDSFTLGENKKGKE